MHKFNICIIIQYLRLSVLHNKLAVHSYFWFWVNFPGPSFGLSQLFLHPAAYLNGYDASAEVLCGIVANGRGAQLNPDVHTLQNHYCCVRWPQTRSALQKRSNRKILAQPSVFMYWTKALSDPIEMSEITAAIAATWISQQDYIYPSRLC